MVDFLAKLCKHQIVNKLPSTKQEILNAHQMQFLSHKHQNVFLKGAQFSNTACCGSIFRALQTTGRLLIDYFTHLFLQGAYHKS